MLNATVLDVGMGLILVYLMLSAVCSVLNERIQGLLEKRAAFLETAIRSLLRDAPSQRLAVAGESAGAAAAGGAARTLADDVLGHGLIAGMSHRGAMRPSYLSAATFASALFDAIAPPEGDKPTTLRR